MWAIIKEVLSTIPTDILFTIIVIFLIKEARQIKNLNENFLLMRKDFENHVKKNEQSDREVLRGKLRRLHLEISFAVQAGKRIPEQLVEEFYSMYEIYKKLGGNGYIEHLKEEVDRWLETQEERLRAIKEKENAAKSK